MDLQISRFRFVESHTQTLTFKSQRWEVKRQRKGKRGTLEWQWVSVYPCRRKGREEGEWFNRFLFKGLLMLGGKHTYCDTYTQREVTYLQDFHSLRWEFDDIDFWEEFHTSIFLSTEMTKDTFQVMEFLPHSPIPLTWMRREKLRLGDCKSCNWHFLPPQTSL